MNTVKQKRRAYVSECQKRRLIQILRSNYHLAKGIFTPTFKFKDAQRKWQQIAAELNEIPGGRKDWRVWRRTWQDLKKQIKRKRLRSEVTFSKDEDEVSYLIGLQNASEVEPKLEIVNSDECEDQGSYCNSELISDPDPLDSMEAVENELPESIVPVLEPRIVVPKKEEPETEQIEPTLETDGVNLKEEYYKQKLKLLEREVIAKERMAAALEKIAERNVPFV